MIRLYRSPDVMGSEPCRCWPRCRIPRLGVCSTTRKKNLAKELNLSRTIEIGKGRAICFRHGAEIQITAFELTTYARIDIKQRLAVISHWFTEGDIQGDLGIIIVITEIDVLTHFIGNNKGFVRVQSRAPQVFISEQQSSKRIQILNT